jgi:hypothetical protein
MITWKGKEDTPLPYWVMDKNLAEMFVRELPVGIECTKFSWAEGNWEFWLKNV